MAWTETYAGGDPVKELEEFKHEFESIQHRARDRQTRHTDQQIARVEERNRDSGA